MEKISKILLFMIIIGLIIVLPHNSYAENSTSVVDKYVNNIKADENSDFDASPITNIVNKLLGFLQVGAGFLTVLLVASTGFRYIVETPEVKGDILKTVFPIVMGLIFVFFAASITKFILSIGSNVT